MREVRKIVRLQRVLILRTAVASSHGEVLHRLEIQRSAGNIGAGLAYARNHLVGAYLALAEGFELHKHARSAAASTTAGEGTHGVHRRILRDDIGEHAHLLRHGRERKVLIALDLAVEPTGILLREEALRSDPKEIDIEANGANGDQQNQKLVAQDPAQADVVGAQQTVEQIF